MRVHQLALSKSGNLPDLPVSSLYLLAAPSTPEPVRDEVLDLAANGDVLTHAKVKEMIAKAKNATAKDYEDQIAKLKKRYDAEAEKLRADFDGALSSESVQSAIDEALEPLLEKIKRLEKERKKQREKAPKRKDSFGKQATVITNALRSFASALVISSGQLIEHEQVVADATGQSLAETMAEFLADAKTAHAWLSSLLKEESRRPPL